MGVELLLQTLLPAFVAGVIGWWRPSAFWWVAGVAVWLTIGWASSWYWWPTKGTQWLPFAFWVPAVAALLPKVAGRVVHFVLITGVFLLALWALLSRYPEALLGLLLCWLWLAGRETRDLSTGLGMAAGASQLAIVVAIDGSLLLAQSAGAMAALAGLLWLVGLRRGISDRGMIGAYVLLLTLCWQFVPMDLWVVALALVPPLLEQLLKAGGQGAWRASTASLGSALVLGGLTLWLIWPEASLY
ncbi:hypothetical protein [Zobellella aerophila]|uniref:Prepilin type IV endopeptidase peptidase domain-containing protein n=1 Tax=Zobellella aerophila TaxID=870480 RepID=A0ABP6VAL4_9GAMM